MNKEIPDEMIIINDEPFYRIPNGTSWNYAPIPKDFKPYFDRLQQTIEKAKQYYYQELSKANSENRLLDPVAVNMFNILEGNK